MASLESRKGHFHIVFRHRGRKITRSLKTTSEKTAKASMARLEDNLGRVELGTLDIPEGVDAATFLLSDGRRTEPLANAPAVQTLTQLIDAYFDHLPDGALAESTLQSIHIHTRKLKKLLGARTRLDSIDLAMLQRYVVRRSKDKGVRGRLLSPATVKKEMVTLTLLWNWARQMEYIVKPIPKKGLRYPKLTDKPPFQTYQQIERRIARGGISIAEEADLWACLFLTQPEVDALLDAVRQRARYPFIYPMFVMAAHTGARRSELLRCEVDDIDLVSGMMHIREQKRVRGRLTTRSVPLSPRLAEALDAWFDQHPGGRRTFCQQDTTEIQPVSVDESNHHFKKTLRDSRWDKLRGWHVLRHSFCSNCAAQGVDQRLINGWVGHQTEEMVRRYRHLIPGQQQEAIRAVFGDVA